MKVLVVKPFRYAHDHHKNVLLEEGQEVEIHDNVVEGLEKEGYIVVGLPEPISIGVDLGAGDDLTSPAKSYDSMSQAELLALAAERGIELNGASRPRKIIAALVAADQKPEGSVE